MPCIQVHVSQKLTDDKKTSIKASLGKAIELIPGKSESWLMVMIHDDACIYFKGNQSEPTAFVDVSVYGQDNPRAFDKLTAAVCDVLGKETGTPANRIYVKYSSTENWGWNGGNF